MAERLTIFWEVGFGKRMERLITLQVGSAQALEFGGRFF